MRYVLTRLLWMVPTVLGITLITFVLLELTPGDRARLRAAGDPEAAQAGDGEAQRARYERFLRHFDLVDPATGAPRPLLERYGRWLGRALRFDFAAPDEDPAAFRDRFLAALSVTLLLNLLAFGIALLVGVPLGSWLGMRTASPADRALSGALLALAALPEFLVATLLLLLLGGGLFPALLPAGGLRSAGASEWQAGAQAFDLLSHLLLPVATLALGPTVVIARFVRESVARAARSEFVRTLRDLGQDPGALRRCALRNGLAPLCTLLGGLVAGLVSGSVVVESVFSLPGLGGLAFAAVSQREYAMVLAVTLLASIATLVGLLLADLLHRALDPRVRLA
ncbi:MAG: ABC transporter permease [Planctomycetes bacterium]|nr:ABC transporter permease [Planctomycetota bacterium]